MKDSLWKSLRLLEVVVDSRPHSLHELVLAIFVADSESLGVVYPRYRPEKAILLLVWGGNERLDVPVVMLRFLSHGSEPS